MKLMGLIRVATVFLTAAAVTKALREQKPTGDILGVPYDFTPPTSAKIRSRLWNPEESRIFTPNVFGVGWSVNLYQVARRLATWYRRRARPDKRCPVV